MPISVKLVVIVAWTNEAERHRPATRLWASFSRAAPRVQLLRQYQDIYAIFHLELENYGPSPTNFH